MVAANEPSGTRDPRAPTSSLILLPPDPDRTCVAGGDVFLAGNRPPIELGTGRDPSMLLPADEMKKQTLDSGDQFLGRKACHSIT